MFTRMVSVSLSALVALPLAAAGPPDFFGRARQQAEGLSHEPFREVTNALPPALLNLNYVQEQSIQFRTNKALWANEHLPFRIAFFLPGRNHAAAVEIDEVSDGNVRRVPFEPDLFEFGTNQIALPPKLGYAGLDRK